MKRFSCLNQPLIAHRPKPEARELVQATGQRLTIGGARSVIYKSSCEPQFHFFSFNSVPCQGRHNIYSMQQWNKLLWRIFDLFCAGVHGPETRSTGTGRGKIRYGRGRLGLCVFKITSNRYHRTIQSDILPKI